MPGAVIRLALLFFLLVSPALAQQPGGGGAPTSVSGGCGIGVTGSAVNNILVENYQNGTGYTVSPLDCGKVIKLSNASPQSLVIPQSGSTGFTQGFATSVCNIGAATWTISPVSGTIGGLASYPVIGGTGTQPVCVVLYAVSYLGSSDYGVISTPAGTVTGVSAGCGNTTGAGQITIAGTVKSTFISVAHSSGDTINANECGGLGTFNSGSAVAITLPTANGTGFPPGWFERYSNYGAGTVTFTVSGGHFLTSGTPTTFALTTGNSVSFLSSNTSVGNWDVSW